MKYNLHANETDALARKLAASPASKIIAIYSMYGVNTATEKLTRIHLADPSQEGMIVADEAVDEAALTHYWGVCSR